MPLKMNAAVVEQFGKPLELQELDVPSPGEGQILLKTEACGVCHTDLHAAHGDWPGSPHSRSLLDMRPLVWWLPLDRA
jgi:propanol-preferring alcohol dehydrogenase